jgi:hypothetical protein
MDEVDCKSSPRPTLLFICTNYQYFTLPQVFRTDHTDSTDSVKIPTLPAKVHMDSVLVRTDSVLVRADSMLVRTDCMASLQVNIRANST